MGGDMPLVAAMQAAHTSLVVLGGSAFLMARRALDTSVAVVPMMASISTARASGSFSLGVAVIAPSVSFPPSALPLLPLGGVPCIALLPASSFAGSPLALGFGRLNGRACLLVAPSGAAFTLPAVCPPPGLASPLDVASVVRPNRVVRAAILSLNSVLAAEALAGFTSPSSSTIPLSCSGPFLDLARSLLPGRDFFFLIVHVEPHAHTSCPCLVPMPRAYVSWYMLSPIQ